MDIAYQIATMIAGAGYGTLGTDIFVGQMPSEQNGIYVMRGGGQLNNYLPLEEAVLDIYIKDTSASTAISTLENIKRYIHRLHTTISGNAYIYSILVLGDVEDVDRDLEYAKLFKITLSVLHRSTGVIS